MKTYLKLLTLALALAGAGQTMLAQTAVPNIVTYQGRVNVGGQPFTGTGQFKFALVSGGTNTARQAFAGAPYPMGVFNGVILGDGGAGYTTAPTVTYSSFPGGSGGTATATVSGGAVTSITVNNVGMGYFGYIAFIIDPPPAALGYATYWSHDNTSTGGGAPTSAVTLPVVNGLFMVPLGDTNQANMAALPANVATNDGVHLRIWFNDGTNGFAQLTPDQALTAAPYALVAKNLDGPLPASQIILPGSIASSQLASGAAAANLAASGQSSVPSGGIILSPNPASANLQAAGYVKLGTVNLGEAWDQRGTNGAPTARYAHSAVWTGSEMLVWGGAGNGGRYNDGGRYNPAANSWTAMSTIGAPSGRTRNTAVWTGSEMIVWGGDDDSGWVNDGGRYNPSLNSWTAVTTSGAPAARDFHTAVWTGSEMIIWGGYNNSYLNDGGRYNPTGNSWTTVTTSGAPVGREQHTAVWTGSAMIVWGGYNGNSVSTGGRYNPTGNSWTAITNSGAPTARYGHTAVWTGSEMIVWGGGYANDGKRYNPTGNSWTSMTTNDAPVGRNFHTALWTGSEMIVWGGNAVSGLLNDGGRYNPTGNSWTAMTTNSAPAARNDHTAVWTGTEMIVWGGNNNGSYYFNDVSSYAPLRTLYLYQRP